MKRLLLLVLLAGCSKPADPPTGTRDFVDSRGKTVKVAFPPKRIVSIIPSATELLYAVGAGDQVAGVTTYCDWPPEAKAKPKIGDIVVDYERLAALKPDVVVTSWSTTKKSSAEIEGKGYALFSVEPHSFGEIVASMRALGILTGHEAEGERAAAALDARVKAVVAAPGPTVYFEHSADPLGTTGPDTYAGDAIRRAGGRNIFEGGWKLIDWEAVMSKDPEVILIAHAHRQGLENRAGWKNLRAVKNGRVHFVALEHYVYPTPRLADGLEEAAKIFREKNP